MTISKTWTRLIALLAVLALIAAACGDDDDDDGTGESETTATTAPADTGDTEDMADTEDTAAAPAGDPEPTNGFDGESITLGYLVDESGPLAILGGPLTVGSQVYWDYVNEELGGVAGKYQVELAVGDTKDDQGTAVTEYQRLKDDAVLFAEILSTPPTQAVLEFLKEDNIVGVPGSLAGAWASEANLLPNGAAYENEMINLADWYVNESGLGSVDSVQCSVSIDDLYGEAGMAGVNHAAEGLGFELAEEQTIARGDTDFSSTVAALDGAGCEAVYAVTVPTEQNELMAQALSSGFEPVWLGALPSYLNLFAAGNPERFGNFYIALDSPDLNDTDVPGMANFLDRFATYGDGEPGSFQLSGYFQQIAVHALLEKAVELGDLSREGIATAMTQLGEVDTEGLTAENYVYGAPEDRVPTSATRIFQFDPDNPPNLLTEVALVDSELNDTLVLGG